MKARVAFGLLLIALVGCGNDGGDSTDGSAAGAPSSSGSGGNAAGAGPSGGSATQAGANGQSGTGTSGGGAAGTTQGGAAAGGADSGGAGAGGASGAAGGGSSSAGNGGNAQVPPTLTALEPSTLPVGNGAFELVLRGTNWRSDHLVSFDGNSFPTTFVSAEELRAQIPGIALGSSARNVSVFAERLGSPILRSNVLMFAVTEP